MPKLCSKEKQFLMQKFSVLWANTLSDCFTYVYPSVFICVYSSDFSSV